MNMTKIKKEFLFVVVLVIGATIAIGVDFLIGINWKNVSRVAQFVHTVIYILWGVILGFVVVWLKEKQILV